MTYPARSAYRDSVIAAEYDQRRFTGAFGRWVGKHEILKMLEGLSTFGNGALFLDAPAGTLRLTEAGLLAGQQWLSADISSQMLVSGMSSRRLERKNGLLGAIVADIEDLPLKTGSVDAVGCLRLMGHLPPEQKKKVVLELLRVSRMGAVVMFARRSRFLQLKRKLAIALGLRGGSKVWFAETDAAIESLIDDCGGVIEKRLDLVGLLSESRVYVIRHRPQNHD